MLRKIIFLDRDGVINVERGDYTYKIEDFKFVDGLFSALEKLKQRGFEFVVITNQGGISKKIYNHNDLFLVHSHMREQFTKHNIPLLAVFYCPHHNEIEKCICRKPDSLMLEKAIAKYQIDVSNSYFIGDSERDILAAQKVNV
ncbi:MAG: HAD family hydrolase, partial [Flavobacteriales bacterium]|nr:HAD family hydrolase [Flavobacteriales bacterium]